MKWKSTEVIGSSSECRGLTLVEILVALVILGISLVTVMQLFSGGLKANKVSGDYTRAIFHAREKMEEMLLIEDMVEGVTEGEFSDGFKWHMQISPFEFQKEDEENTSVKLYTITVRVGKEGWRGKSVDISTLKLINKKEL